MKRATRKAWTAERKEKMIAAKRKMAEARKAAAIAKATAGKTHCWMCGAPVEPTKWTVYATCGPCGAVTQDIMHKHTMRQRGRTGISRGAVREAGKLFRHWWRRAPGEGPELPYDLEPIWMTHIITPANRKKIVDYYWKNVDCCITAEAIATHFRVAASAVSLILKEAGVTGEHRISTRWWGRLPEYKTAQQCA